MTQLTDQELNLVNSRKEFAECSDEAIAKLKQEKKERTNVIEAAYLAGFEPEDDDTLEVIYPKALEFLTNTGIRL